jgi:hypothetical protein
VDESAAGLASLLEFDWVKLEEALRTVKIVFLGMRVMLILEMDAESWMPVT